MTSLPLIAVDTQGSGGSIAEAARVPVVIEDAGAKAKKRFVEFLTARIENDNTRIAYAEAIDRFLHWCMENEFSLERMEPVAIAAYFKKGCPETRSYKRRSKPNLCDTSKKQHLAAVREMFDYLVTGGVLPFNPASAVKGPKVIITKGKTPVLDEEDARTLIGSIDTSKIIGLRDKALIGVMCYSFARVGATLAMNVEDVYLNNRRHWIRLHEKGGKFHEMPLHHKAVEYLLDYMDAANLHDQSGTPLFRTLDRKRRLTERRMTRHDALRMVKRRARNAGVNPNIGNHTWRGTGLTSYFGNGGTLEKGQMMAAHSSARTTKLYDRTRDTVDLDEVEKVRV